MEAEQSIEDRIVAQFDDEPLDEDPVLDEQTVPEDYSEAPEDEIEEKEGGSEGEDKEPVEDDSEPESEYVEIDIDGKTYEVPKELEAGFLQQKDYTQKTQSLASERKQFEFLQQEAQQRTEQFTFAASIQDELTQIATLDSYLSKADELNWAQMSSDEMIRAKHELDQIERQKGKLVEGLTAKQKEFQEAQEQSRQELLKKGAEVLRQKIPGWDEAKQKELRDYAVSAGFTEQELARVYDPRQVQVIWKASQFDKLQKGVPEAKAKLKETPAIKPKSRTKQMTQSDKDRLALHKAKQSSKSSSELANSRAFQDRVANIFDA